MGFDAGVSVKFYNKDLELIDRAYIDCYKCRANKREFILKEGVSVITVRYSTEFDTDSSDSDSSDSNLPESSDKEEN